MATLTLYKVQNRKSRTIKLRRKNINLYHARERKDGKELDAALTGILWLTFNFWNQNYKNKKKKIRISVQHFLMKSKCFGHLLHGFNWKFVFSLFFFLITWPILLTKGLILGLGSARDNKDLTCARKYYVFPSSYQKT